MSNLFVVGFPGLYGGASTELHHQLMVLKELTQIHIIPTFSCEHEPLLNWIQEFATIHAPLDFSAIQKGDMVISFCCGEFLSNLEEINKVTDKTCFVNCMTWLFDDEKEAHSKGLLKLSIYQRDEVMRNHRKILTRNYGSPSEFLTFTPYFHAENFKFVLKDNPTTNLGRISRADADKFTQNNFYIWERIVSPKWKKGYVLGWNEKSQEKVGKPFDWIKTFRNQTEFPVSDFYSTVDLIVQPTDTTENLPRIGFEAMSSGVPLVVDNRGGWRFLIEHGVTGFLCNHERDFIYWGSRLAYEDDLRWKIAEKAKNRCHENYGFEASKESWRKVLEFLAND